MELHGVKGLSKEEVSAARGRLKTGRKVKYTLPQWTQVVIGLFREPMILMLLVAAGFYLSTGKWQDSIFLCFSVMVVASISFIQEAKSRNAMASLMVLNVPKVKAIRDGSVEVLPANELLNGDAIIIEEGGLAPADGVILHSNDLTVNESLLTGESFPVSKSETSTEPFIFQGTAIVSGLAIISVFATGVDTRLSKIESSMNSMPAERTPLEKQLNNFVVKMALLGFLAFLVVWLINYQQSGIFSDSLLKALTLAMSVLPEEIPVAFSTFMAIGAWKLMKIGVLVKNIKTVEALGSAGVICLDKTGTITQNKMTLAKLWSVDEMRLSDIKGELSIAEVELIEASMWASEPLPFDPMEKSIHEVYTRFTHRDKRSDFRMVQEYPLSGKPPMMTHVFEDADGHRLIACKGAPEAVLKASGNSSNAQLLQVVKDICAQGYRVLGVAICPNAALELPAKQEDIHFILKGFIAFYDPPKENIAQVITAFYGAGVDVKIITGDNPLTSAAIARQIKFKGIDGAITGEELMALSDEEVQKKMAQTSLFTRMFPEAKLRIINLLKASGHVVAMTGDGVNDAPALKAAHIGIAMGTKGTEVAKEAATLILMQDDLFGMVEAIAAGRRIYCNLKKAIQYIISIHIPIILIVFIPLILGWVYPNLFSPVHVIMLEVIMGPTCSLIYENEPAEPRMMSEKPRLFSATFFSSRELLLSVVQGLVIAIVTLLLYTQIVARGGDISATRTMVFTTLIFANITLTVVNRSFYYSVLTTMKYRNNLIPLIIMITMLCLFIILYVEPARQLFGFTSLDFFSMCVCFAAGFVSVAWYEIVKWIRRNFRSDH